MVVSYCLIGSCQVLHNPTKPLLLTPSQAYPQAIPTCDPNNLCDHFFLVQVVHELPYALQFATFSLVLFFIVNVMYGHRWQTSIRLFSRTLGGGGRLPRNRPNTYGTQPN